MFDKNLTLNDVDPDIAKVISAEEARQEAHIELIASENYTSPAVMYAQGCQMTNKYAEGYPGKRYYGGCEVVDEIESLAIDRLKKVFNASWANVQPHSGAQANTAVFLACLKPGDKILGLDLSMGGHLTRHTSSARQAVRYRRTRPPPKWHRKLLLRLSGGKKLHTLAHRSILCD